MSGGKVEQLRQVGPDETVEPKVKNTAERQLAALESIAESLRELLAEFQEQDGAIPSILRKL